MLSRLRRLQLQLAAVLRCYLSARRASYSRPTDKLRRSPPPPPPWWWWLPHTSTSLRRARGDLMTTPAEVSTVQQGWLPVEVAATPRAGTPTRALCGHVTLSVSNPLVKCVDFRRTSVTSRTSSTDRYARNYVLSTEIIEPPTFLADSHTHTHTHTHAQTHTVAQLLRSKMFPCRI